MGTSAPPRRRRRTRRRRRRPRASAATPLRTRRRAHAYPALTRQAGAVVAELRRRARLVARATVHFVHHEVGAVGAVAPLLGRDAVDRRPRVGARALRDAGRVLAEEARVAHVEADAAVVR